MGRKGDLVIKGLDVASYQSETPDLDGMDFCFVKATEGTSYINPKQWAQAEHARNAGLVVGFYHYLQPGDMKRQAAFFVSRCVSVEGDPLWADWEEAGVSCAEKDEFLREVIRLRGATHRVGLYCSTNYWLNHDTTSYCADALWIAHYGVRPGHPGIRHDWTFHQYTSSPIDTNVSTFASRAALKAWCTEDKVAKKEERDMTPEQVYKAVWRKDGIMEAAWGAGTDNPTWMPESVLEQVGKDTMAIRAQLDAQAAVIDKLADAVGKAGQFDPTQLKDEIRSAIESVKATVILDVPDAS